MLRLPWRRQRADGSVFCVFRYPDATASRWLERLPAPGTRVRSPTGRTWIVDEVLQSGRETYTVYCVSRRDREGDLAAELLEAARRAREAVSERRRKRKYRSYLP